jgi:dihydroflavonol-4-reductase
LAPDRVFLTGASGFVGSHVLRELRTAGYRVSALVRDARTAPADCDLVFGDLRRTGELVNALSGCRFVVHCAALYSFAPADRAAIRAVNVLGTAGLLEAARVAGVERVVITSSSAAVGHERNGRPANEGDYPPDDDRSPYHQSKLDAERAAFSGRVPVVAVLPTAPVGPGDWKPTPTGKMVLDFARGKMFAKPPGRGGMNLVAVEDVARAHVAALERGRPGERYIIGGENLTMDAIWDALSAVTGVRPPQWRVPYALAACIGWADEWRCRLDARAQPLVPREGVRMSRERMYVDDAKSRSELGLRAAPVAGALQRAVAWYRSNGYLG